MAQIRDKSLAVPRTFADQKPRSQTQGASAGWIPSARLGKNKKKRSRKAKPGVPKNRMRYSFWSHLKAKDNFGVELFSGAPAEDDEIIVDKVLKLKISNPNGEKREKKNSDRAPEDLNENVKNKLWADKSEMEEDFKEEMDKKVIKKSIPQVRTFGVQVLFETEVQRLKYLNFIKGEVPKVPGRGTTQKEIVKDYLKEKNKPEVLAEDKKRQRIAKRVAKQAEKEKSNF